MNSIDGVNNVTCTRRKHSFLTWSIQQGGSQVVISNLAATSGCSLDGDLIRNDESIFEK